MSKIYINDTESFKQIISNFNESISKIEDIFTYKFSEEKGVYKTYE